MADRTTKTEQQRFQAIVHGRVQGVSFRYYTQRRAVGLGLKGYVRNLPDGTVEVVAQGPEDAVRQLHFWLHRGPRLARVRQVKTLWQTPMANLSSFEVRF